MAPPGLQSVRLSWSPLEKTSLEEGSESQARVSLSPARHSGKAVSPSEHRSPKADLLTVATCTREMETLKLTGVLCDSLSFTVLRWFKTGSISSISV